MSGVVGRGKDVPLIWVYGNPGGVELRIMTIAFKTTFEVPLDTAEWLAASLTTLGPGQKANGGWKSTEEGTIELAGENTGVLFNVTLTAEDGSSVVRFSLPYPQARLLAQEIAGVLAEAEGKSEEEEAIAKWAGEV